MKGVKKVVPFDIDEKIRLIEPNSEEWLLYVNIKREAESKPKNVNGLMFKKPKVGALFLHRKSIWFF